MKAVRFLIAFVVSLATHNLPTKILSLFLAVVVWFALDAEITDRTELEIPIDVILANKHHWTIVEGQRQTVTVTIKGPRSDIARMGDLVIRERLRGLVSFDEAKEIKDKGELTETHTIPILPSCFNLPKPDITFERIRPNRISVTLVKTGSREIRVKPNIVGVPAKGYRRKRVKVTPAKVTLEGPLIVLNRLESIATDPVFLDGRDANVLEMVNVVRQVEGYAVQADRRISVEVIVVKELGEAVIERVPLRVAYPPRLERDRFDVEIAERLDVKVRGPVEILARLTADDILLVAELKITDFQEWTSPEAKSQPAKAVLICTIAGPDAEARREIEPDTQPQIHYKITKLPRKD